MKQLLASLATLLTFGGLAVAGPVISKNPIVDPRCECFATGLGVGGFVSGILWDGDQYDDDALGGGVDLTYFFTENLGVNYSYSVFGTDSEKHVNALDFVYRMPLGNSCLAPYFLGGGGVISNGSNLGLWRAGVGAEYRLPNWNCSAIFADATWNWISTNDDDAAIVRLGYRVQF
jgi:hypothetical protein